ncbi:MAG: hypothetical protein GF317_09730 [Candidatus Lokiarchaeota archaeon]|nr:hypothetical protein [Candidatus Lokiarchaeota archaeon]MBD3199990.1 hypothetical protein [Candidatus Lokiarchaeota archaeon]
MKSRKVINADKIVKTEKFQSKLTNYIVKIGKWLVFIFPIILIAITVYTILFVEELPSGFGFTEQDLDYQVIAILYFIILGLYFINSIILLLGAIKTKQSLRLRLDYERGRGRPIESLDGFKLLSNNVSRVLNLLKVISLICIASVILFLVMLIFGELTLGFAAMGTALIGLGLALLIRSLNLNIHDVNGLQDFFKPTTHEIFLDNFFAEIFSNHLDPITFLKWDEFVLGLNKLLNPEFIEKVKKQEEDELPITFALEKMLFLYYLHYQDVLSEVLLKQEFKEIINIDSDSFDIEKGLHMEGDWYFSASDIYRLFDFIREYNPGFYNIIDRLQLELADNITRLSKDPIYMDSSAQEVVYIGSELNIMVFLYNNSPDPKKYRLRIAAPGFEPDRTIIDIKVEGRGSFLIPSSPIPLTSEEDIDITGVLSTMLENGDTTWITLEPREKGEQTIQIFLEREDGTIIEGKTRTIKVTRNLKDYLKKLSSIGSLIGGLAVPISRILPSLLQGT